VLQINAEAHSAVQTPNEADVEHLHVVHHSRRGEEAAAEQHIISWIKACLYIYWDI
jgi:hypothetical protein